MIPTRGSAGPRRLALLAVFFAACLPGWVRRAPSAQWDGDVLTAEAVGSSEHVSFPLGCDLARKKAELAARDAADIAWATRFGTRPQAFSEQNVETVGQERPSDDACYALVRFTARAAPAAPAPAVAP